MSTLRGEQALDFMFGDAWRKLNRSTEERDKAIAEQFNEPCSQPACAGLACVTVDAPGGERAVCRSCADVLARDEGEFDWPSEECE